MENWKRKHLSLKELEHIYSERVLNYVKDRIRFSKLQDELDYKPMVMKEHKRYMNTLDVLRDNMSLDRTIFIENLGYTIGEAYSKAFEKLFNAGKQQTLEKIAYIMKSKNYAIEDISEITGLTPDEIKAL